MLLTRADKRWQRTLLAVGAMICWGFSGGGGARAQGSATDANQNTPAAAPAASQSGGLDTGVNPNAPAAALPAPAAALQAPVPTLPAPAAALPPPAAALPAPVATLPAPAAALQPPVAALPAPVATLPPPVAALPAPVATLPPPVAALPAPALPAPAAALPAPVAAWPAPVAAWPAPVAEQRVAAPPIFLDHPRVVDTAKLQSGDTTVSLYGIEGVTGASAQGLQGFLASLGDGRVTCQAQASSGYVCLTSDRTNVAQVALVNGAAKTTPDAPDSYREQEAAAQAARRGIWVDLPPPPETVNRPIVQDTATLSAGNKTFMLDGILGFPAPYSSQLQAHIAENGDSVTCSPQNVDHYICLLPDGTDVAKVALVNGAARVAPEAPDSYRVQQLDALNNRRGYWLTAPAAMITAALAPVELEPQYVFVAGDDGVDGITYVGGEPMAMIDGESVFLDYGGDDLGWGYYDHSHHWQGAPDSFRRHMEHFHPGGHGLRGDRSRHDAGMRREEATRGREEGMRGREEGMRGREEGMRGREEGMRREEATRHDPAMRGREEGIHGGAVHPGTAGPAGHPGFAGAPGRAGNMAMSAGRPGTAPGGQFMRPGAAASAGGFHPGAAPAMHAAAPAAHAAAPAAHAAGGGGGGKHK